MTVLGRRGANQEGRAGDIRVGNRVGTAPLATGGYVHVLGTGAARIVRGGRGITRPICNAYCCLSFDLLSYSYAAKGPT